MISSDKPDAEIKIYPHFMASAVRVAFTLSTESIENYLSGHLNLVGTFLRPVCLEYYFLGQKQTIFGLPITGISYSMAGSPVETYYRDPSWKTLDFTYLPEINVHLSTTAQFSESSELSEVISLIQTPDRLPVSCLFVLAEEQATTWWRRELYVSPLTTMDLFYENVVEKLPSLINVPIGREIIISAGSFPPAEELVRHHLGRVIVVTIRDGNPPQST